MIPVRVGWGLLLLGVVFGFLAGNGAWLSLLGLPLVAAAFISVNRRRSVVEPYGETGETR